MSVISAGDAWYTYGGAENDVVLSSRTRLARNLANFPFPARLRGNDGQRVQSIVFDAFNHIDSSEDFQAISVSELDNLGCRILKERGILSTRMLTSSSGKQEGIILRSDGKIACTVNIIDHVRISSFVPGLDFDGALEMSRGVDSELQQRVQFAASHDFGYLTSEIMDSGSGMKLAVRVHLPSLSFQRKIKSVYDTLAARGLLFTALYGSGSKGSSLGAYYELSSSNCGTGSEFDQMATVVSAAKQLADMERNAREECMQNHPTDMRNNLYRSLALAKSSLYITLQEAIDIISGVKLGVDMKLIEGIDDTTLHALLYRIQEGHLEYVLKNGDFSFEDDILSDEKKKIERLRALILQEAFDGIGGSND